MSLDGGGTCSPLSGTKTHFDLRPALPAHGLATISLRSVLDFLHLPKVPPSKHPLNHAKPHRFRPARALWTNWIMPCELWRLFTSVIQFAHSPAHRVGCKALQSLNGLTSSPWFCRGLEGYLGCPRRGLRPHWASCSRLAQVKCWCKCMEHLYWAITHLYNVGGAHARPTVHSQSVWRP